MTRAVVAAVLAAVLWPHDAGAVCVGGTPDGVVATGEDCDDGNATAGDGCEPACTITAGFSCARAIAIPSLTVEAFPGSGPAWTIEPGGGAVRQAQNTPTPTVAMFGAEALRGTYEIDLEVQTANDDDFVGFALGFQPGDALDPTASYLLLEWKQAPQSGVAAGLRLVHVRGTVNGGTHANHEIPQLSCASPTTSCATELERGRRFGDTGWQDAVARRMAITYRTDRLEVRIDNVLELDVRPADFPGQFPGNVFPAGQLGFYNLSQEQVVFTDRAPAGASRCNLADLTPLALERPIGTPSVTVPLAAQLVSDGDALDPASIVIFSVTGAASAVVAGGNLVVTPANPAAEATYVVDVFACDDDPLIRDCDRTTITIDYGRDTDGDGRIDRRDLDDDDDGILDADEPGGDRDGDGLPDRLDLDADGDGVLDVVEAGLPDVDGDGRVDCPGGRGANGACDAVETAADSGVAASELPDADGDGVADVLDLDSDGDGLGDLAEGAGCTDAAPADGLCDGADPDRDGLAASADALAGFGTMGAAAPPDSDVDGVPDVRDLDSDGDGIFDLDEAGLGAHDADDDGLVDGDDPDGDGLRGAADTAPDEPGGARGALDSDGDGIADQRDPDADGDGLPDHDEAGLDPANPVDSEGDGTPDFQDPDSDNDTVRDAPDNCRFIVNTDQRDLDGDGLGDACDADADGDDLPDDLGIEGGGGCASAGGAGLAAALAVLLLVRRRRPSGRRLAPPAPHRTSRSAGRAARRSTRRSAAVGGSTRRSAAVATRRSTRPRSAAGGATRRSAGVVANSVAVALALLVPDVASAEQVAYPVERFQLTGHRDGILGVEWAGVEGHLTVDAGVWFGYADDPLVLYRMSDDTRVAALVGGRLGGDIVAAVRLQDRVELGLGIPLVVAQRPEAGSLDMIRALDGLGLGDIRFVPKVALVRGRRFALAIAAPVTVPTATSDYGGDRGPTTGLTAIASVRRGPARASLAVGGRARAGLTVANLVVDDELYAGLGAAVRRGRVEVEGALSVTAAAGDPFAARNGTAGEVRVGAGYTLGTAEVFAAAGTGLGHGFGAPNWRLLVGLRLALAPRERVRGAPAEADDLDGDGVVGAADRCPTTPEDRDGHEDGDGCPDPDDDDDGVLDEADACRDVPGAPDLRGCPDPDRDADGIADRNDACPTTAGVAPHGCADRDGDGVPDPRDNCPGEAGTVEHAGCRDRQLAVIGTGKLEFLDVVYFAPDSADVEARSLPLLDNAATVLLAHPELGAITVEGHTDDRGDPAYNKRLSQRRAEAVVAHLARRGVPGDRMSAAGFGPERPRVPNTSDEGRSTNRRVEIVFAAP